MSIRYWRGKIIHLRIGAITLLTLFGLIHSNAGVAVTARAVRFSQTGRNFVASSLADNKPLRSICRITVINRSTRAQTVSVTINAFQSSTYSGAPAPVPNPDTLTQPCGPWTLAATPSDPQTCTTWFPTEFPAPTGPGISISGSQELTCHGTVTASDTDQNPGSVVASGAIETFTQSGDLIRRSGGAVGDTFRGPPIFNEVPIVINRGESF